MALTAEARAKGRQTQQAKRAAKQAVSPAGPPADTDPLRDLAALVVQAASKDAEEQQVLDQFTRLLERIDLNKHPELRDHPAMQGLLQKAFDAERPVPQPDAHVPPGTVVGTGLSANAVPWTWNHVQFLHDADPEGMFRLKTVMCTRTQQVIINGLGVWFPEGQEVRWYAPWVDEYVKSVRAPNEAIRHAQWLFKVGPWAPNIPVELQPAPDPSWLEDGGLRMRAEGEGMYRPGMGWNPAVDGKRYIPGVGPAPDVAPGEIPVAEGQGAPAAV